MAIRRVLFEEINDSYKKWLKENSMGVGRIRIPEESEPLIPVGQESCAPGGMLCNYKCDENNNDSDVSVEPKKSKSGFWRRFRRATIRVFTR